MTDQTPNPNPNLSPDSPNPTQNPHPSEYQDWREERRAERMRRRDARWQRRAGRPYGWFIGAVLVLLGIIFLLENLSIRIFANWWALFILIPAFWAFVAAWNIYQDYGRITAGVVGSLSIAIVLTLITGIFLFNLALGIFWPILLIVAGLAVLITGFSSGRSDS